MRRLAHDGDLSRAESGSAMYPLFPCPKPTAPR